MTSKTNFSEKEETLDPHSNLARFAIDFINMSAAREYPATLVDAQFELRGGELVLWTKFDRDIRKPLPDTVVTSGPLTVNPNSDDAKVAQDLNDAAVLKAAQDSADANAKKLADENTAKEEAAKREQEARDVAFAQLGSKPQEASSQDDAKAKVAADTKSAEDAKAADKSSKK